MKKLVRARRPPKMEIYPVGNCTRCEGFHEGVGFRKFTIPPVIRGQAIEGFGICPRTQEPILSLLLAASEVRKGRRLTKPKKGKK